MSRSSRCCARLPRCRLEWWPASQFTALLLGGGLLAMLGLIESDLPRPWLNPLLAVTGLYSLLQAWHWQRRPRQSLVIDRGQGRIWCDGQELERVQLRWRCGLLVLDGVLAGQRWRRVFLPAQLHPAVISELRQWPARTRHSTSDAAMAP